VAPDSVMLVILLFAGSAALIVLAIRLRRWLVRAPVILLAMAMCAGAGIGLVNVYYGYYQTWGQLAADLSGSYVPYRTNAMPRRGVDHIIAGRVVTMKLPGTRSGITRQGMVYLPPQYDEPRFAHTRFPVLELIHGSPGQPSDFFAHMDLAGLLDKLIGHHMMGPVIVVTPQMNVGRDYQEGVDGPHARDDTYLTYDVRQDVLAHLRASTDPAQWGIAGYSSGGYCAANLALRHRAEFGAAAIIDGYFRPTDGAAAAALGYNAAAEAANDPILAALALTRSVSPLPAFWISVGTEDPADVAAAQAFADALAGVQQVELVRQVGASHNFYAFRPAVAQAIAWMWRQLAPPDQRVQFPIAAPARDDVLLPQPMPKRPGTRDNLTTSSTHR